MRLKSRQPTAAVSPRATEGHSAPQQREVRNDRDALPPGHRFVVVGQELDLKENEQRKRPDHQADQRDQSQHGAVQSGADLARPGKKLHEDVARKLAAQAGPDVLVGDLRQKLCVEDADFVGQHREVQQHISVHDQEYRRSQYEEAEEGQLDAKERKFDRAFEQQIAVRHAADGDDQIKQHEQIAEPQPALTLAASTTALRSASRSFALPAIGGSGAAASGLLADFASSAMARPRGGAYNHQATEQPARGFRAASCR